MKAIQVQQFGEPEAMQLTELPQPRASAGEVLVRVQAAGVNPVETYIRSGKYARLPALPYTPGSDAAGVIAEVGEGVSNFQPGDRVYTAGTLSGAYAEFALCTVAQVHRLPARASFAQGAALGVPYATAYRALFQRAKAVAGETVLVHGASGGVGVAAVQLAHAQGMKVFGTAGTARGCQLVSEQGADAVFDHHAPDYLAAIREKTAGRGVNVIVEMLANVNLGQDLTALAPGGRVAVVGSRGKVEIDPRDAMMREADIRGVLLGNASPAELAEIHNALFTGLENKTLRPVIGEEIPLAEAARAHRAVMAAGTLGKIVLIPG
jgi:NADPH2:quinone reductase